MTTEEMFWVLSLRETASKKKDTTSVPKKTAKHSCISSNTAVFHPQKKELILITDKTFAVEQIRRAFGDN